MSHRQEKIPHCFHGMNVPWQILTLLFVAIVFFLMVRGVHLSTRWAGYFFVLEMAVLLLVSVVVLVTNGAHLSLAPFNPLNIAGGLAGFGLGFPIAVYMFIGWENSASLAEETTDPRRNVPRAIYTSILLMGLSYLLFINRRGKTPCPLGKGMKAPPLSVFSLVCENREVVP